MKQILAIAGSLRRGSYNRLLLAAAAAAASSPMTVRLDELLGRMPMFNEDTEHDVGHGMDAVRRLRQEVADADGLLIATPEYNHSFPGALKNAIDWLSRPGPGDVLTGKPVAIIGASTGRWGTRLAQPALRQVLQSTASLVMPTPMMFVGTAGQLFDDTGRLIDLPTRQTLDAVLHAFANWIDLVAPTRTTATCSGRH